MERNFGQNFLAVVVSSNPSPSQLFLKNLIKRKLIPNDKLSIYFKFIINTCQGEVTLLLNITSSIYGQGWVCNGALPGDKNKDLFRHWVWSPLTFMSFRNFISKIFLIKFKFIDLNLFKFLFNVIISQKNHSIYYGTKTHSAELNNKRSYRV